MTTQNMKLLDLQTGQYLELGRDWGFFGEFILLNLGSTIELNIKEWGSVSYSDNAYGWHGFIGQETKRPHTNPIINEIAETVGAVVYGGRYVLLSCETWLTKDKISVELMQGHIFRRKLSSLKYYEETPIFLIDKETLIKLSGIKDDYTTYSFETSCYSREFLSTTLLKSLFRGNIFEEYSKQLRNEPNKFDELNQHFK